MLESDMELRSLTDVELSHGKLPLYIQAIWSTRNADFQKIYDIHSSTGIESFLYWLITNCDSEFSGSAEKIRLEVLNYAHAVDGCQSPCSITLLLKIITRFRNDLGFINGLSEENRAKKIWSWFLVGGFKDYGFSSGLPFFESCDPFEAILVESGGYTFLMPRIGQFLFFNIPDADGSRNTPENILVWFYKTGIWSLPFTSNPFGVETFDFLCKNSSSSDNSDDEIFNLFVNKIYQLIKSFDNLDLPNYVRPQFKENAYEWWMRIGQFEFFECSRRFSTLAGVDNNLAIETPKSSQSDLLIMGYPKGEFGLGEDIRLLKTSLSLVDIESTLCRVPGNIVAREKIDIESIAFEKMESSNIKTLIFSMPAFDTMLMHFKSGYEFGNVERKIGFWQWELENFPLESRYAFDLVDEVWCHSRHSENAFKEASNGKVVRVPLPVSVPNVKKIGFKRFGLEEDAFIFFTSFDGASYISRKNPLATIDAFQLAFPRQDQDVRLVIKVMNQAMDSLWRECLGRIAKDDRIILINEVLDRDEYFGLLRSADAVISLHRAEGFGRLMAEAMAYGIPVIASSYSGNLDFMDSENSWLIPGELIPVYPGDYPFQKGQRWFAADVHSAAKAMVECRDDKSLRIQKAEKGMKNILTRYNPEFCGNFYKHLLEQNIFHE